MSITTTVAMYRMILLYVFISITLCFAIPPDQDDFYNPPDNLTDSKPGDILKIRPIPSPIKSILSIKLPILETWQILVRSQDLNGLPNSIITTLIIPKFFKSNKIISHQSFENSPLLKCSPSYAIQTPNFETLQIQTDLIFISGYLNQGYIVNLPDHEGPNSSFLIGKLSAYTILNSIRAIEIFMNFKNSKIALIGYSTGGFASIWASMLNKYYSPELNIIGVVSGGTIGNITSFIQRINGGPYAGLIVNIFQSFCNEYNDFKEMLINSGGGKIESHECLFPSAVKYFMMNIIGDIYNENILYDSICKKYISENNLIEQELTPQVPVLLYHSRFNEMTPMKDVEKLKEYWCSKGVQLEIAEDLSYNHMVEAYTGIPAAITWIENHFNKSIKNSGCKHVTRITNLNYPGISPVIKHYINITQQVISHIIP